MKVAHSESERQASGRLKLGHATKRSAAHAALWSGLVLDVPAGPMDFYCMVCVGELLCNHSRRLKFGLSDWQGQSGGQRTALTQLYQAIRLVQKSSGDGSSFKISYIPNMKPRESVQCLRGPAKYRNNTEHWDIENKALVARHQGSETSVSALLSKQLVLNHLDTALWLSNWPEIAKDVLISPTFPVKHKTRENNGNHIATIAVNTDETWWKPLNTRILVDVFHLLFHHATAVALHQRNWQQRYLLHWHLLLGWVEPCSIYHCLLKKPRSTTKWSDYGQVQRKQPGKASSYSLLFSPVILTFASWLATIQNQQAGTIGVD